MAQRIDFARTAQRTTEAQLELLKMIAESEGATQTVAAIDKILKDRAAKVDEVLDQAREERRQERIKELEEKRKAREEMRQNRRERAPQREEP
jgi:GTP1/Obg family GTP-binding protein